MTGNIQLNTGCQDLWTYQSLVCKLTERRKIKKKFTCSIHRPGRWTICVLRLPGPLFHAMLLYWILYTWAKTCSVCLEQMQKPSITVSHPGSWALSQGVHLTGQHFRLTWSYYLDLPNSYITKSRRKWLWSEQSSHSRQALFSYLRKI